MAKVLTIELEHEGYSLISELDKTMDITPIMETLEAAIKENAEDALNIEEGDTIEYMVRIHRKRSRNYMNKLEDFTGF